MTEDAIQLAITGKLSYSDRITIAQAARIIGYLNSGGDGVNGGEFDLEGVSPRRGSERKGAAKVENPREALELSGASTNPEKIVALAAYALLGAVGSETFKAEDVKSLFRRARETPPANFGRDLSVAIGSGWIFEADDAPGEYYLNSKIDPIFDGDFTFPKPAGGAGGRQRVGSRRGTSKAKSSKSAKPESLADVDDFRSTLDGFPSYAKMKMEKDRLLWIVNYMSAKHGRKGLSNKEIAWISDHIGVGIPSDNVAGAFNSAKGPGFSTRSTIDRTIKITEEGVDYLKSLMTEK